MGSSDSVAIGPELRGSLQADMVNDSAFHPPASAGDQSPLLQEAARYAI
jgi:hypothetical protein